MGNGKISKNAQNLINNLVFLADKSGNGNGKIDKQSEQQELSKSLMDALSSGQLKQKDFNAYTQQSDCPLNTVFATDPIETVQPADTVVVQNSAETTETTEVTEEVATESVTETQTVATNPVKAQTTQTVSKQQAKINQELVEEYVRDFSKNKAMTLDIMMKNWDNRTDLASFTSEKAQVQAIADIINAQNAQSKKDINNLDKIVRNALGKNMTKLQKDILPDMLKLAERDVMVKTADAPVDKYIELTAQAMKNGETKTYQQLYDEALQASGLSGDYKKEAAQMLKEYVKRDAYKNSYLLALQEIYNGKTPMDTKQIIAQLNQKFANDPIMLEVIKENEKIYRNNTKEGPADVVARALESKARQDDLSGITQDDISDLEKKNPKLATKLWAYVQSKGANEDGTYSMNALYDIINKRSGADFFTNKSRQKILDESVHILEDFKDDGLEIDKNELKQLLEFMSRKYAKNTHYFGDAVGVTPPAAIGAAGVIPAIHKDVLHLNLNISTLIKMTGASEEVIQQALQDITSSVGDKAVVTATGEGINTQVHIQIVEPSSNILSGLTGAAVGIAAAILTKWAIGEAPDELACTNLTEDVSEIMEQCGNDPQKLKDYIAKRHPENATRSLFMLIDISEAKAKKEGKEFNTQEFIKYISKIGGSGSLANCQELLGAFFEEPVTPVTPTEEPVTPVGEPKYELDIKKEEETVEVPPCSHKHYVKHGDTWSTLIHTYYQDTYNKYGWKATLKALREALGAKATDKDLPYYRDENGKLVIELPCELLEIQNDVGDLDKNRRLYNTNKFEAGARTQGKPLANVKMTLVGYYAWDNDYVDAQGNPKMCYGDTPEQAVAALEDETKKTYENREEKINQFK